MPGNPSNKEVNNRSSGLFSAGLLCLSRYLEHIEGSCDDKISTPPKRSIRATSKSVVSGDIRAIVIAILEERFPNGFRNSSPIELSRFRSFVAEDFNEKIVLSDEELTRLILSCGILFNGKVYIVGADVKKRIKGEIDSAISEGIGVIFYGAFYRRHEDWLFSASVISEDMLRNILVTLYPQYVHRRNYLSPIPHGGDELIKIGCEAFRVWGDDVLLSFEQLSERLPYIPIDKIKCVLAQNGDFVWNSEGVYTHISKVNITDIERTVIKDYVAAACRKDGYASLSDIPFGEISERNYELSLTALHNAVFAIVLSGKYYRRGKIITHKDDRVDALSIMEKHCRSLEKCSLQDLLDFERELTGETHRWIPMEAGYAVMVRTIEDTYVAEKHVRFDVRRTDNVLDRFVKGNYLPLKNITTFAAFPECRQAWNLFLLESYCRRFSQRFRFEALSVNSKNVGAIVRKDCTLSYIEIMADAVVNSGIALEKPVIEEYLYCNGYLGKRSYTKTDQLIQLAKNIQERKN
jgi:hypothetical protein